MVKYLTKGPNIFDPFYIEAGKRMKAVRKTAKDSYKNTGDKLGVSYQQIQKNESGRNRTSLKQAYLYSLYYGISINEFLPDASNLHDFMQFFSDDFTDIDEVKEFLKNKPIIPATQKQIYLTNKFRQAEIRVPNIFAIMDYMLDGVIKTGKL